MQTNSLVTSKKIKHLKPITHEIPLFHEKIPRFFRLYAILRNFFFRL